jgi:uncharacterized protein (TIGR03435 family)
MIRPWIAAVATGISATALMAQETAKLDFDAASIKARPPVELMVNGGRGNVPPQAAMRMARMLFRPHVEGGPGTTDPGRIAYTNVQLNLLLRDAYGLRLNQITGPDWIEIDGFDVVAKIPPNATMGQFREMLRNLLTERFRLRVHKETRDGSIYTLVVNKGGAKLSETSGSGEAAMKQVAVDLATVRRKSHEPYPEYKMTCANMTMAELAAHLGVDLGADSIDRPVTDGTGLTARYNFDLKWASEAGANAFNADNIIKALQKQLGLKLESRRGSIEVLVVDQASEIPVEN